MKRLKVMKAKSFLVLSERSMATLPDSMIRKKNVVYLIAKFSNTSSDYRHLFLPVGVDLLATK